MNANTQKSDPSLVSRTVFPAILMAAAWYLLAGESPDSWLIGVPAILIALGVLHFLPTIPTCRIRFARIIPFVIYFIQQSIAGGLDVAYRAFHPDCPVKAGFLSYPIRLKGDFARVFFVNAISLLPGTLSVHLRDKDIRVHVLDMDNPNQANLRTLEDRVAYLFGEAI